MKAICVTGATGFIGRSLVRRLRGLKVPLIFMGRRPPEMMQIPSDRFCQCNLETGTGLDAVPWPEIGTVIHLAAKGAKFEERQWETCYKANVIGTKNLLAAIAGLGGGSVERVIASGTCYEKVFLTTPSLHGDPYVASKWGASQLLEVWGKSSSCDVRLLHVFHAFGGGGHGILNRIQESLARKETFQITSGDRKLDFIHVDEVVEAFAWVLNSTLRRGFSPMDVGSGKLHSIREAAEMICDYQGVSRSLLEFSGDNGALASQAEGSSLYADGWKSKMSLASGIERFVRDSGRNMG